jgi:prophage regulatory protein
MIKLLKISDLTNITKLSKSSIYKMISNGNFPNHTKIGRVSVWSDSEINEWINHQLDSRVTK